MRFQGYAKGAIKTRAELLDLVIEARKGKKAIRLYSVEQGGHFGEHALTSRSKIETHALTDYDFIALHTLSKYGGGKPEWYRNERCLGDLNIVEKNGRHSGHNRHQLFSNRRCAEEYAARLAADAPYQQAIKDFHKRMGSIFNRWAI